MAVYKYIVETPEQLTDLAGMEKDGKKIKNTANFWKAAIKHYPELEGQRIMNLYVVFYTGENKRIGNIYTKDGNTGKSKILGSVKFNMALTYCRENLNECVKPKTKPKKTRRHEYNDVIDPYAYRNDDMYGTYGGYIEKYAEY